MHLPQLPWSGWILIGGLLCAYGAGLFWTSGGAVFWSPDEGGKYLLVRHLAAGAGPTAPLVYPGAALDPDLAHVPLLYWLRGDGPTSGAIFSWWPIWFPLVSAPFYGGLGLAGLHVVPLAGALICLVLVFRAVRAGTGRWGVALAAAGVLGLTTPLYFYALTFWEHTAQAALVLAAFGLLAGEWTTRRRPTHYVGAGVLLGLAVYLRLETIIFGLAAGLAIFLFPPSALFLTDPSNNPPNPPGSRWRLGMARALGLTLGFIGAVLPLFFYNWIAEGHWLGRRYALTVNTALARAVAPDGSWAADLLPAVLVGSAEHQGVALQPLMAWGVVLAWAAMLAGPWLLRRGWDVPVFAAGFALVGLSGLTLLDAGNFGAVHGLVLIAPALAFGPWALAAPDPIARRWGWLAVTSLLGYLLFSLLAGWPGQGGLQWGPRYALPLYPIWTVAGALGLAGELSPRQRGDDAAAKLTGQVVLAGLAGMILVGGLFQMQGTMKMAATRDELAETADQLAAFPPDTLFVTDVPYLALSMPDIYLSHTILLEPAPLQGDAVNQWRRRAYGLGYQTVCAVGLGGVDPGLRLICHPTEAPP